MSPAATARKARILAALDKHLTEQPDLLEGWRLTVTFDFAPAPGVANAEVSHAFVDPQLSEQSQ